MTWRVVKLSDVVPTPWKNGGGTTRELIAWPDSENWVWRMSVAEVAQSGPFSRFDGVQRWFAVLDGAGVVLTHNGKRQALTVNSAPLCFDGGLPTACELLDGATQDFNLMVRIAADGVASSAAGRACAGVRMERVRESTPVNISVETDVLSSTIKTIAIYSISTWANVLFNGVETSISPRSLVWRKVSTHDAIRIAAEDALLIEIDVANVAAEPASALMATHLATSLRSNQ